MGSIFTEWNAFLSQKPAAWLAAIIAEIAFYHWKPPGKME